MSRRRSGGRGRGAGPARSHDRFIQDSVDECDSLSGMISSVMEASTTVAEDLQVFFLSLQHHLTPFQFNWRICPSRRGPEVM